MKNDFGVFMNFWGLVFILVQLKNATAQSPPLLVTKEEARQLTVRPGAAALLECPVRNPRDVILEWYKDREAVMTFGNRIRKLSNGSLKIKETVYDDTGVYKCRAVNGFGSVEFNTTLLVIGTEEDYDEYETVFNAEDDEEEDTQISLTARPKILFVSETQSPILKPLGSSFMFQCVATGQPKPEIMWYKENIPISDHFRLGRWALKFSKTMPTDAGNYTCMVSNLVGKASHSFILEIDEPGRRTRGKPLITGFNTTVEEGQKAVMKCSVESASHPHIEWLKQVESENSNPNSAKHSILMEGEHFTVLTKPFLIDYLIREGVYYHKLMIENAQPEDAGKYVCLGANTYGYSFQFTYLDVISTGKEEYFSSMSFPIVVTVIVIIVTVFGCIFVLMFYYRPRHERRPREHSVEVPMVTKEGFTPMQTESLNSHKDSKKSLSNHHSTYSTSLSNGGV